MAKKSQKKQDAINRRIESILTEEEVDKLIAQVPKKSATGLRNRAMLAAMLGGGLRVSEVVALMPRDVDMCRGEVVVRLGKGGKSRVVPVSEETVAHLQAWAERRLALGHNAHHHFFCALRRTPWGSEKGDPITVSNVQAMVKGYAEKAGIGRRISPHQLRHTYASRMLDAGHPITDVQEALGHSSLDTTMIYLHANPAGLRRRVQANGTKGKRIAALQQQLSDLQEQIAALSGDV